ncbi:hypothetical protein SPI_03635 [Niveomyces insectorum RCEF 264]|uniref:Uncharacterized protein n=1 Tax=Niveomyces insectorum RCEF 264 TaxID=1081102 RepID=A0A162J469_9HYPO|nr:hypothetical protein SPI_03635 [Niveomyces insectorum RCEF 264]
MERQAADAAAADDIEPSIKALYQEAQGRPVHALLARYGRERLFVPPLLWDHRQPALLQCRFLPLETPAPPLPPAPPMPELFWKPLPPDDEMTTTESLQDTANADYAHELLEGRYPLDDLGYTGEHVVFRYGRKRLCHVGHACVLGPRIVFLVNSTIRSLRDHMIRDRFPGARQSSRIFAIARRRFTPPESMPDPYIAAICIALAQSHVAHQEEMDRLERRAEERRKEKEKNGRNAKPVQMKQLDQDVGGQPGPKPTQATPVVVVVHEGEHLSVFAADVTAAFLAKLDEPNKPPPPGASMDIHQQRVPFHPYETFAGRYAGAVRDTRHSRRPDD